jgi:hypothetical protein
MTAALIVALAAAAPAGAAKTAVTCLPATPVAGVGVVDPFRPPDPKATELNSAGKSYYRDGKWEEARIEYRAAEKADPAFLAPRLNVACSFVRQERFEEATAEVEALLARAYVPWAREVLEAADLGALKPRPEMARIRRAMTSAAAAWGGDLDDAVLFVGRARTPLKIPDGPGFFILKPHQEVYAFLPATGRFRQLTAEDGRVLGMLRTPDRRRVVYVTAEKLIRGARGDDVALRGVAIGELTLATMTAEPPIRVEGDIRRIELGSVGAMTTFRIEGDRVSGLFRRGDRGALDPLGSAPRRPGGAVVTARGAEPAPDVAAAAAGRGGCRATVREVNAFGKPRALMVSAPGRPARRIGEQFGAGLVGLPIP